MSELYKLPDGWEWKPIEDLCEILDRLRKPISQKDRISGQYPYYGATGIVDYVNDYIFDERLLLIGEDGAKWGANENTAFIADGKYWVNNHAHIMRPNREKVLDMILVYYLNATDLMDYITGATVKKLNQQKLKSIKIPLPPLVEQKRIVAKLDNLFANIDKAIALHQKNIDEADAFMGSVLNDVFGELEEKYGVKQIESLFKIKSGDFLPKKNMVEDGDFNVYGGNGINGMHNEYNLSGENIIIGRVGALCGNVRYINGNIWLTDNAFYVSEYFEDIDKNYLTQILIHIDLGSSANQAAQPVISYKGISEMKLPLPPLHIQQKVVKYLDEVSEKIEKVKSIQKEKMDSLKALKASILDKAFRGEL
jgi:type I restriction enzyme S subunit